MKACGGSIQTSVQNLGGDVLGTCEDFEEVQIGGERYWKTFHAYDFSEDSYMLPYYFNAWNAFIVIATY